MHPFFHEKISRKHRVVVIYLLQKRKCSSTHFHHHHHPTPFRRIHSITATSIKQIDYRYDFNSEPTNKAVQSCWTRHTDTDTPCRNCNGLFFEREQESNKHKHKHKYWLLTIKQYVIINWYKYIIYVKQTIYVILEIQNAGRRMDGLVLVCLKMLDVVEFYCVEYVFFGAVET